MPGALDRHKAAMREQWHEPLAVFEWYGVVLLSPNNQDRPRMFTDTLQLIGLIHVAVGDDLRQTGAPESFVLHLISIALGPIGKLLRMQEVAELAVGPGFFIQDGSEVTPHPRHTFDHRQRVRLANRRIEVNERSNAISVLVREAGDQRRTERNS